MGQKYISSKNNAQIAQICKLKQKKHRDQTGLFYVEGAKLLKEALNSRYRENIRYIIATENMQSAVLEITDVEMIFVADELYKKLSDESAPEGVMCVLQKPPEEGFVSYKRPVVALCSLRDPGNVGAIVRSADALGGFDLVLSGDCADIYSQKTQRAAMGAIFRQNIKISENIKKDIENLKKNGYNIFAAHLDRDSQPIGEVEFTRKTAVLFGNEGSGLDAQLTELCDGKLIVPINAASESLNVAVAAGIVLWEIAKAVK